MGDIVSGWGRGGAGCHRVKNLRLADRVETDLLGLLARLCLIRAALLKLF